jgi:hypothetical protein
MVEGGEAAQLERIERYLDAVPRSATRQETLGPFTLFVQDQAWPYYARPAVGGTPPSQVAELTAVLDRQRELGLPETIEWVEENCPSLASLARDAGLEVHALPLMVLTGTPADPVPPGHAVRLLGPDDRRWRRRSPSLTWDSRRTELLSGWPARRSGTSRRRSSPMATSSS